MNQQALTACLVDPILWIGYLAYNCYIAKCIHITYRPDTPMKCHHPIGSIVKAKIIISYHSSPVAPQRTVGRIAIMWSCIGTQAEPEKVVTLAAVDTEQNQRVAIPSAIQITAETTSYHVVDISVVVCSDHQGIGGSYNHQLVYAKSGRENLAIKISCTWI